MSIGPIFKKTAKLLSILAFSVIAAIVTISVAMRHDLRIKTPGMIVADLTIGANFALGERVLVVIGVDSMVYFLLIWGSIRLLELPVGKS